jgi:hypothetical protein
LFLSVFAGFLLVPAGLVAGWIAVWFVHRPRRWLYYFPAGLGAVVLCAVVVALWPKGDCESSTPMMCVSDVTLFGVANALTGFWTWLGLLVTTGVVELVRLLAGQRGRAGHSTNR